MGPRSQMRMRQPERRTWLVLVAIALVWVQAAAKTSYNALAAEIKAEEQVDAEDNGDAGKETDLGPPACAGIPTDRRLGSGNTKDKSKGKTKAADKKNGAAKPKKGSKKKTAGCSWDQYFGEHFMKHEPFSAENGCSKLFSATGTAQLPIREGPSEECKQFYGCSVKVTLKEWLAMMIRIERGAIENTNRVRGNLRCKVGQALNGVTIAMPKDKVKKIQNSVHKLLKTSN